MKKYMKKGTRHVYVGLLCFLSFLWLGFCSRGYCASAQLKVSGGVFLQGIDLKGMDRQQVIAAVNEKIAALGSEMVTVTVADHTDTFSLSSLGLKWTNPEIVDEIMHLGTTGNIVSRYKDQKDLQNSNRQYSLTFTADEERINAAALTLQQYNCDPVNATIYTGDDLTPHVDGGTDGISVDIEQTTKQILESVNAWNGVDAISVEAPLTRVKPDVPYEKLAVVSDVLGTATTDYSASSWGRATNVENGCRKISGTLLYPGETFSVTAAVTPFTAENGYEQAPTYEENRVVNSYGGGICQVSTTLYNAVLKSELEVISRSNHTMVVSYVALSKDAAIAEGVMDMAFVNNKEDPIYIIGYCYGGTITFTIFGHETRPANRTLEFESITTSTTEPTSAKFFPNASQSVGYINQTQSPHTGYTAELWKHIYIDGVWSDSVQINSSSYTAVGTIYDVGVASDSPAVTQAMYTAIASGSLSQIQATIANAQQIAAQTEAPQEPEQEAAPAPQEPVVNEYGDVDEVVQIP